MGFNIQKRFLEKARKNSLSTFSAKKNIEKTISNRHRPRKKSGCGRWIGDQCGRDPKKTDPVQIEREEF